MFLVQSCRVISAFSPQHVIYVSTITLPCFAAQQCVDRQNNSCASLGTFALMRPLTKRASARGRKSVGATAHCLLILSIGSSDINRCMVAEVRGLRMLMHDEVDLKLLIWKQMGNSLVGKCCSQNHPQSRNWLQSRRNGNPPLSLLSVTLCTWRGGRRSSAKMKPIISCLEAKESS